MFTSRFYTVAAAAAILVLAVGGSAFWGYNKGFREAEIEGAIKMANFKAQKEQQLKEVQQAASLVTEKVVVEYVDRVQEVVKNRIVYRDVIKEVLVPSTCSLSNGWVQVHDAAATNSNVDIQGDPNTDSNISDTEGLNAVVENYSVCHQTRDQLVALQNWVKENYSQINGEVSE